MGPLNAFSGTPTLHHFHQESLALIFSHFLINQRVHHGIYMIYFSTCVVKRYRKFSASHTWPAFPGQHMSNPPQTVLQRPQARKNHPRQAFVVSDTGKGSSSKFQPIPVGNWSAFTLTQHARRISAPREHRAACLKAAPFLLVKSCAHQPFPPTIAGSTF